MRGAGNFATTALRDDPLSAHIFPAPWYSVHEYCSEMYSQFTL